MNQIPILMMGDSPTLHSGLARIGRDLATLLSRNPRFRVGYVGFGGNTSVKLPFQQYVMTGSIEYFNWMPSVMAAWNDFAGDTPGVLFTIWDLSRMLWLTHPETTQNPEIIEWRKNVKLQHWAYLPIDSEGPNGKLTAQSAAICSRIDRVLTYSPWAKELVERSTGRADIQWMPHGLNGEIWRP